MEQTPRTDAASRGADFYTSDQPAFAVVVPVELARSLERELSEVTKERDARGEALKRTAAYKFDRDLKRLEEELIGAITRAEAAERELEELLGKLALSQADAQRKAYHHAAQLLTDYANQMEKELGEEPFHAGGYVVSDRVKELRAAANALSTGPTIWTNRPRECGERLDG